MLNTSPATTLPIIVLLPIEPSIIKSGKDIPTKKTRKVIIKFIFFIDCLCVDVSDFKNLTHLGGKIKNY